MKALEPKESTREESARLSWEDTAREMQASGENWSEWDPVAADGVESLPWIRSADALRRTPRPRRTTCASAYPDGSSAH